jgi:Signal transduction histidine kinase regulating citrate/malate metabolism
MLDQIKSLFTFIFAIGFMYLLLDCNLKAKKKLYLLIPFATIFIIVDAFIIIHYGYFYFMKLYPLLVYLPMITVFAYISKFKLSKVIFVNVTTAALVLTISLLSVIIAGLMGAGRDMVNIISCILFLPYTLVVYKLFMPSILYMLRNLEKGWLSFSIIPVSYTILLYTASRYDLTTITITYKTVVISVLILILAVTAYYQILRNFKQTREQINLQNEQNMLKTQVEASHARLETMMESQEKTIIYRHDMRHHLNLISAFLADNNITATKKYIDEVQSTIASTVIDEYCRNYAVNLILSSYISKAKKDLISVETQINIPESNHISDIDLCVIFSNSIENAIHACLKLENPKERLLKIVCQSRNEKLFIKITNSYSGTLNFINAIPVSEEENHGIGTKSIVSVVNKYQGIYSFTTDNNLFDFAAII